MQLSLAENIREYRKGRKLTQEKLAEILGVTVGAVYKWEAGLSVPELNLIVEMADFFDISVDVLLGHKMKDNRIQSIKEQLETFLRTQDLAAITEAEKALGKYPHSFDIVYICSGVYFYLGSYYKNEDYLRRSLELAQQSLLLLPQNTDPQINESTISGSMAAVLCSLGEEEKGIQLLKQNNIAGIFDDSIGVYLAFIMDRPEEAAPFLSDALLNELTGLLNTVFGYCFLYQSRGDFHSALNILNWGIQILTGSKTDDKSDFLEKAHAELLILLAFVQRKLGMEKASYLSLQEAQKHARSFDSVREYSLRSLLFGENLEKTAVFDSLGATTFESIALILDKLQDPDLTRQWKELTQNEHE